MKGPKYQRGFLGIVSAIVSVASAAKGISDGRKAAKAQRGSNEAQRRINKLRNKQAKRQFLQNFRQAQAAAVVGAVGRGVGIGSSGTQGTLASQQTQARVSTNEFNVMDELGGQMTAYQNAYSKYSASAATWGAVSNFASQFISFGAKPSGGADPRRIPGDDSGAVTSMPSIFNVGK